MSSGGGGGVVGVVEAIGEENSVGVGDWTAEPEAAKAHGTEVPPLGSSALDLFKPNRNGRRQGQAPREAGGGGGGGFSFVNHLRLFSGQKFSTLKANEETVPRHVVFLSSPDRTHHRHPRRRDLAAPESRLRSGR